MKPCDRNGRASLALIFLLAIFGSPSLFAQPHTDASAETKLVFFGDSLTAGYGLTIEQAYPALIAEKLKPMHITVVNAGSRGDTTAAGLRRIDWVLKQKPKWIVIALGGNDMLRGIPVAETERNLKAMIQKAKASGAEALLFGMKATPNLGADYVRRFNGVFAKVARESHVDSLDFFIQPVAGKANLTQADSIHPTTQGQIKIADYIWPFILHHVNPK